MRRAEAAHRAGISALTAANLKTVFITHLHSDHTLGLPDLMLARPVGRNEAARNRRSQVRRMARRTDCHK